jgi:hypothetical protein
MTEYSKSENGTTDCPIVEELLSSFSIPAPCAPTSWPRSRRPSKRSTRCHEKPLRRATSGRESLGRRLTCRT